MEQRISSPAHFRYSLDSLFFSVDLVYFAINQLKQIYDGETLKEPPEHDRFAFNLSTNNIDRPYELLQLITDIIRVNYEPQPFGSVMLNANPCFLYDAVPSHPFELGYLSVVSESGEDLGDFWKRRIEPYAKSLGYNLLRAPTLFIYCSTGSGRYSIELSAELHEVLQSTYVGSEGEIHAGFSNDESLGNKLRISLMCYF